MNPESVEELKNILTKSPAELTAYEKAVLRARRDYLTKAQKDEYKAALKGDNEPEAGPDTQPEDARAIIGGRDLETLPKKDLMRVASRLDVPHRGTTKQALIDAIQTKLGPEAANDPE